MTSVIALEYMHFWNLQLKQSCTPKCFVCRISLGVLSIWHFFHSLLDNGINWCFRLSGIQTKKRQFLPNECRTHNSCKKITCCSYEIVEKIKFERELPLCEEKSDPPLMIWKFLMVLYPAHDLGWKSHHRKMLGPFFMKQSTKILSFFIHIVIYALTVVERVHKII